MHTLPLRQDITENDQIEVIYPDDADPQRSISVIWRPKEEIPAGFKWDPRCVTVVTRHMQESGTEYSVTFLGRDDLDGFIATLQRARRDLFG